MRGTLAQSEHLVKHDQVDQEDLEGFESVGSILRRLFGVTERDWIHTEMARDAR